jgi:hypothetical protein
VNQPTPTNPRQPTHANQPAPTHARQPTHATATATATAAATATATLALQETIAGEKYARFFPYMDLYASLVPPVDRRRTFQVSVRERAPGNGARCNP